MRCSTNPLFCAKLCFILLIAGLAALAGAASTASAAAEPAKASDAASPSKVFGYDDTPLLPNSSWRVHDRNRPQPPMVTPGTPGPGEQPAAPPSDAIVLFDGKDLAQWEGGDERGIEQGCINILKTGELRSKRRFGDCQLHIEWVTPAVADGGPMNWGNSGVFLMDSFEVQIIESNACRIYADGIAGAIYGQTPPLVNASREPGQWQCFDIVFTAPRFDGDKLLKPAYATVLQNGVLVQYHQEILGATQHKTFPEYKSHDSDGPIRLQKHGSAVRLRNIWVRRLQLD